MRCLVTGAAGFIGSHLTEALLDEGHDVIGIDNLVTGRLENLSEAIKKHPKFSLIAGDIAFGANMDGIDWVFHLAALADIVPSIQNPVKYHQANVNGTLALLEDAKQFKVKKFLYAASSSCYGIPDQYPTAEEAPCEPRYPYALTKYVGEQYVMHWSQVYKIPAVSLRLFNVFGPRHRTTGNYGAVFGTWLAQMANDMPITIVGDGTQTRDFTYVKDVARAFIAAADSPASGIFNVGSGNSYTIQSIADILGATRRIHIPRRPGEPDCTWAQITKIKRDIGWVAKTSISEGIAVLKSHIRDYKTAPLWTPEKIEIATKPWFEALGGK